MVVEAIVEMKQTAGSNRQVISKSIEYKYGLEGNVKESLSKQLMSLTEEGKIVQVRSSFKLAVKNSKRLKAKEVKKAAAKTTTKKKVGLKEEDNSAGSLRPRSKPPAAVDTQVKSLTPVASTSSHAPVKGSSPAGGKFKGSTPAAVKKIKISTPRFEAQEQDGGRRRK